MLAAPLNVNAQCQWHFIRGVTDAPGTMWSFCQMEDETLVAKGRNSMRRTVDSD